MHQCQDALDHHVAYFAAELTKLSPRLFTEPDRRIAAVLSFCCKCGLGNYRISTFKRRINAGDWSGAAEECVKWNKAAGRVLPGLTRGRLAEAALLQGL
jgi:lysozyme